MTITIRDFIDSTKGRTIGFALAFGFVPYFILSSVHAALQAITGGS